MTAVYVTHGRKYHADEHCPRMISGEDLHDFDGDIDYGGGFTSGTYRREDPSPQHAAARGKLPCLGCVGPEDRVFPPLYGQTFGHEPVWINEGYCGGCDRCGSNEEREVCARCIRLIPATPGPWPRESVPWPCTSAVVLGLTPREVTA